MGYRGELKEWVRTQVGACANEVNTLVKIYKQHTQSVSVGLEMLLQIECKYLQRTVPRVGTLMGPIE